MLHVVLRTASYIPRTSLHSAYSRTFTTNAALLSVCGPTGIKEAPILENDVITALPDEAKLSMNLETSIMVPVKADLTPINGIPEEYLRTRKARIFQPPKNAMQSGFNNICYWELEFDNRQRWENPLMGWTSTGDPLSGLKVRFSNACEAIEYCEKNGWIWYVDGPNTEKEFRPKNYATNFSWSRRSRISTK